MTALLHRLTRIPSTMDLLHTLAAQGAEAGTAVVAEEQTGGRGSRGRSWHSPRGGLWLSLLYRPAWTVGAEVAGIRVGLAVAEALAEMAGADTFRLKWPNDLMAGPRKLGGILCEARWQGEVPTWVAVGIGLNVENPVPDSLSGVATNLAEYIPGTTVDSLLPGLLGRLRAVELAAGQLSPDELSRFAVRDWLRGRALRQPAAGVADGIAEDGALLVRTADGRIESVRAGTVELADPPIRA
ncbi:MAG: biotin--[acetyl-CoA-carboxylase] ligase [Gemmatimonadales bacterium]